MGRTAQDDGRGAGPESGTEIDRPLTRTPVPLTFFCVGIVVADLEQGVHRLSAGLGVEFTRPATVFGLSIAVSRTGSPHYQLIQATGDDGPFATADTDRARYYGCWEQNTERRLAQLAARGVVVECVLRESSQASPSAVITGPDLVGGRIAYVATRLRPAIEEWAR
ncbi:VOC family protein [Nocardia colli]|uniref:VOC family protein n=1 Tax=Nocardia colli TaxID=2545717 RepID=UPI0035E16A67